MSLAKAAANSEAPLSSRPLHDHVLEGVTSYPRAGPRDTPEGDGTVTARSRCDNSDIRQAIPAHSEHRRRHGHSAVQSH